MLMKKINKILTAFLAAAVSAAVPRMEVHAEMSVPSDGRFYLADSVSEEVYYESYGSYAEASAAFESIRTNYDNLCIYKDGRILRAEYALIYIRQTDACDYNVTYQSEDRKENGYTNGCYGKDALYLDTDSAGNSVLFELSGVRGWMSLDDCEIIPEEKTESVRSSWSVKNRKLIHHIQTGIGTMNIDLDLGEANASMPDGDYYSYDGHYFYAADSFRDMSEDLRAGRHKYSVNADDPYYNYFMYLSHRSLTAYSADEVNKLFTEQYGLRQAMDHYRDRNGDSADDTLNRSQFYGIFPAFWEYQYEYGANAMMMLALSTNESAYGRSAFAYRKNNLFGHAAFDSDAEKSSSKYSSPERSVLSHAKNYICDLYCNPSSYTYHGPHFGNKAGGMNVSYASDPYWGEKAAAIMGSYDRDLGDRDKGRYTIGLVLDHASVKVYGAPNSDAKELYKTPDTAEYAFVILGDVNGYYRVQSDVSVFSDAYDYKQDVGYIKKNDVDQVIEGSADTDSLTYHAVTFSADGGKFNDGTAEKKYMIPDGDNAYADEPVKKGMLFTGWDKETDHITTDTIFKAKYAKIQKMELTGVPQTEYEQDDRLNLKGGSVQIQLPGDETKTVPLTTSMVSGFDLSKTGEQTVTVNYGGSSVSYDILVREKEEKDTTALQDEMNELSEMYAGTEVLYKNDVDRILSFKKKLEMEGYYPTGEAAYRFEKLVRMAAGNRITYSINNDPMNLGVSGILMQDDLGNPGSVNFFKRDSYQITVDRHGEDDMLAQCAMIAESTGRTIVHPVRITVRRNYRPWESHEGLRFSLEKPSDDMEGDLYEVFEISDDGDITACITRQDDVRITFEAMNGGQFILMRRSGQSVRESQLIDDTLTYENTRSETAVSVFAALACGVMVLIFLIILKIIKGRKFRRKKKNDK